jgi:hypothetical protein
MCDLEITLFCILYLGSSVTDPDVRDRIRFRIRILTLINDPISSLQLNADPFPDPDLKHWSKEVPYRTAHHHSKYGIV